MLEVVVNGQELYNEETQSFVYAESTILQMEHSLISISKWESKWHKSFLSSSDSLTEEEIIDYMKCMTIYPAKVKDEVYLSMSKENVTKIIEYIKDPMTASWVNSQKKDGQGGRKETITSELIYYWMIALNIPFECQKWHLNRLLMLVKICNIKNEEQNPHNKKNKMSRNELMSRNAALNAQRKAQLNTRG